MRFLIVKNCLTKLHLILMLLMTCANLSQPSMSFAAEDKVIAVEGDDPAMNAAIDKARSTLDEFWRKLSNPKPNEKNFSVKLKLTDGSNVEHFWCGSIEGDAQSATCIINNDPQTVKTVQAGQRIPIESDVVSDWMYMRDDKIVGGQTVRILLNYMSSDEAENLRAQLVEE